MKEIPFSLKMRDEFLDRRQFFFGHNWLPFALRVSWLWAYAASNV
jgi:hypothetical protein